MIKYNLVIVEGKQCIPFLNLTEQAFYDKLWEWTYEDDLWDYLEENNPSEEDLKDILYQFINEDMFHKYELDTTDCFAFIVDDSAKEYQISDELIEFVYTKIKEHNERNK